jgi:hypothetical protein
VSLVGPRDDQRGAARSQRSRVRRVDRGDVVAVDLERLPAQRLGAPNEHAGLSLVHRRPALSEPVQVQHGHEAVHLVERGGFHRLPHAALRHLGVAEQHEDASGRTVEAHRERLAEPDGEPLAERPGGHVDPRQLGHRSRMSLHRGAEPAERHQLLFRDRSDRLQRRVEGRRGVALRHDEPVGGR